MMTKKKFMFSGTNTNPDEGKASDGSSENPRTNPSSTNENPSEQTPGPKKLIREAEKLNNAGKYEEAGEFYKKAINIMEEKDPMSLELISVFCSAWTCFIQAKNYSESKAVAIQYVEFGKRFKNSAYLKSSYALMKSQAQVENNEALLEEYTDLLEKLEDEEAEKESQPNPGMIMYQNIQATKDQAEEMFLKLDLVPEINLYSGDQSDPEVLSKEALILKDKGSIDKAVEAAYKGYCIELSRKGPCSDTGAKLKILGDIALFGAMYNNTPPLVVDKVEKCYRQVEKFYESSPDFYTYDYSIALTYMGSMIKGAQRADLGEEYIKKGEIIRKEIEKRNNQRAENLENKVKNLDEEQKELEDRVSKVEEEQRVIELQFEEIMNCLNQLSVAQQANEDKLKELEKLKSNTNDPDLLNMLISKEKKLQEKQTLFLMITANQPLLDYYNTVMRDVEAVYVGARAAQSGAVQKLQTTTFRTAAEFAAGFIEIIPVVGKLCSNIVKGIGYAADKYKDAKKAHALDNLGRVAPSTTVFNQFTEAIVLKFLLRDQKELEAIPGPVDKKLVMDTVKAAAAQGVSGIFEKWIKEAESKAAVKGKTDAAKIIAYLQEGYIKLSPTDNLEEYAEWVLTERKPGPQPDTNATSTTGKNEDKKKNASGKNANEKSKEKSNSSVNKSSLDEQNSLNSLVVSTNEPLKKKKKECKCSIF